MGTILIALDQSLIALIFVSDVILFFIAFPRALPIMWSLLGRDTSYKAIGALQKEAEHGDVNDFFMLLSESTRRGSWAPNSLDSHSFGLPASVALVVTIVLQSLSIRTGHHESKHFGEITPEVLQTQVAPALGEIRRSFTTGNANALSRGLASLNKLTSGKDWPAGIEGEGATLSTFADDIARVADQIRAGGRLQLLSDLLIQWGRIAFFARRETHPFVILTVDVLRDAVVQWCAEDFRSGKLQESYVLIGPRLTSLARALSKNRPDEILRELSLVSAIFYSSPPGAKFLSQNVMSRGVKESISESS